MRSVVIFYQVADDGYGVSYIIAGEDVIFYHVTCKVSSQLTVSISIVCAWSVLTERYFSSWHERETAERFWGVKPKRYRFHTLTLYHWATDTFFAEGGHYTLLASYVTWLVLRPVESVICLNRIREMVNSESVIRYVLSRLRKEFWLPYSILVIAEFPLGSFMARLILVRVGRKCSKVSFSLEVPLEVRTKLFYCT